MNTAWIGDPEAVAAEWLVPVLARQYRGHVVTLGYMGSSDALTIEGTAPFPGTAWVVSAANGVGALASATVGDVWEYDGNNWVRLRAGVGGFVASDVALVANRAGVLVAPLVDGVDEEKLCAFDGTSLTPASKTAGATGDSVSCRAGVNAGWAYVFDGGWVDILVAVGGFVAAGARFIAHETLVVYPLDSGDYGAIVEFGGASVLPSIRGARDGSSCRIRGEGNPDEGLLLSYDGAVPTGTWTADGGGGGTLTTGTYAAAPAVPAVGAVHDVTGGPIQRRCYVAGAWVDYMPGVGPVTLPVVADWATALQGGLSLAAVNGGHGRATIGGGAGTYFLRGQFQAHAGPKGYRLHFDSALTQFDAAFGLAFRRVASNKEWSVTIGRDAAQAYDWVGGAPLPTLVGSFANHQALRWLEIIDDGATLTANFGSDLGHRLGTGMFSRAYAAHLGGAPDLVGLCGFSLDGDSLASIYHIEEFVP